tara:strand:+ start:112 stop:717 length:606 start_codon:yes stop_codon:yes gene_type:complete
MPKKGINDYIFYKIVCIDDDVELCYVGSTANWKERQRNHKRTGNNENDRYYNTKLYKTIRENGGWENFKMIQIGTAEQLTWRKAEQLEEEYRVELKANLNTNRCYLTEEQKKEYRKVWEEENKEKMKEHRKEWRENNKEKRNEYNKEWKENNKEKHNENRKVYRENHDKQKITCECGCVVKKYCLWGHKQSTKHIKLMNEK